MFSVIGITATHRIGSFRRAIADMAQITAAPPDMSSFILSMLSAGLIEMPPVSKVMPLPTRPRTTSDDGPRGLVTQDDDTRRLLTSTRDAQQHSHLERGDVRLVEDLDSQSGGGRDLGGTLREDARRQVIAGLVGQSPAPGSWTPR